ncbi:hypothetical protein MMAD_54740 [Mycolicibacterium madagascariense]|uniref:Leucine--tRNA ligase n=1 Tax=Mycolicibacterium madagascariense TaxID=212765 RepID=A0A7I7XPL3_9MYCO|nr:hypothetical protein MMAD_54740 [Mycolicibacterium madagascariense]
MTTLFGVTDGQGASDASGTRHRYDAALAGEIERTWQQNWDRLGTFHVPNPVGSLAPTDGSEVPADKMFVQDMFPYPSGEACVGHPWATSPPTCTPGTSV